MPFGQKTPVAALCSISNLQSGLCGISYRNLLVKQLVKKLQNDLLGLEFPVSFSPLPRLRAWLESQGLSGRTAAVLAGTAGASMVCAVAAAYLLHAKSAERVPHDPVAGFHPGEGEQIPAVTDMRSCQKMDCAKRPVQC